MFPHPHTIDVLAELHRGQRLAEVARYRLAVRAQPIQPAMKDVLSNAVRTMHAIARGAMRLIPLRSLVASGKARDQATLTVVREAAPETVARLPIHRGASP